MSRRDYHRAYYARTAAKRRKLARDRHQCRRWCAWLLANLQWPEEPTPIYPKSHPIRRPTLQLPRVSR